MTDYRQNRRQAPLFRMLAEVVALAGLLALAACGGGSGAPNNAVSTTGSIALLPSALTAYSNNPATLTVAGGLPPYRVFSSDEAALPVQTNVAGSSVPIYPYGTAADNVVTLTVRDARGDSATSTVTIKTAPLVNTIKLKADAYSTACPNPGGSSSPADDAGSTLICSGQTGTVSVSVGSFVGGIPGRLVRFDVVQGAFQLLTEAPGQPQSYALSYTVQTDQFGNAVARIRANPDADQQIVIVQATDVATGTFVRGTFVIVKVVGANETGMAVFPATVTITGPDKNTCSSGVASSFFIYGGQPPYTVANSFPQFLAVSPTVVQASGGGFTVTTLGACISNGTLVVTDALGHSLTVTLTNELGTLTPPPSTSIVPITVSPPTIPTLTCAAPTNAGFAFGGGGTSTTTGETTETKPATTFVLSTNRPDILAIGPPTSVAPLTPVKLTRQPTGTVTGSSPGTAVVNVTLSVFDGVQTKTINVPVTNTCP